MAYRTSSTFFVAPTVVLTFFLFSPHAFAQSIAAPDGWTQKLDAGGVHIYTPGDLGSKQVYSIALFPPADPGKLSPEKWLEQRINADDPKLGASLSDTDLKHPSENIYSYSHVYSTPIGPLLVLYTESLRGGSRAYLSRLVTSPDKSLTDRYKEATAQIIGAYFQGDAAPPARPARPSHPAPPPKRSAPPSFPWAASPGKGLTPGKIEGVIYEGHGETQVGGYAFVESVTLLLKDGTYYSGLRCAPADLNVAASRLHEPREWGRWRRQSGELQVSWNGGKSWDRLAGWFVVPAHAGERLAGNFTTGSAINIAGNISTFHRGIAFLPGGRFQTSRSSMFTSGITSNMATGTSVSAYSDDKGSVVGAAPAAGAMTPGSVAVSTVRKRNPNGANEGSYQLDGYTLSLRYDNGQVTRLPFFFWDSKKNHIWVGTETFDLDKGR